MADLNLHVKITKDDAAVKELLESLGKINASFGGATSEKVKKEFAGVVEAAKKASSDIVTARTSTEEKTKASYEREFQKLVESEKKKEAASKQQYEKDFQNLVQSEQKKEAASKNADHASAESAKQYAKLKAEYEGRSLDDVRKKIMQFEEQTRTLRRARSSEEDAATKKELQARTNAVNTELQLYRSLEKEKIGRTFSEQMERLKLDEKSNAEIKKLLKSQEKEFKELQEKMTVTQNAEEKKRLSAEITELKAENAAVKHAAEERHIAPHEGGEHKEGGGFSIGQVAGVAGAIEGLEGLIEKSKEVVESQHALAAGTGLSGKALKEAGEDAKKLGDDLGVTGDQAKSTMGKVASYTHATGEELNKQTAAVIAYAQVHHKSSEMVAKQLATESGRATIFAEATENVAKAQKAAEDPAIRAQLAQQGLEETMGELASTLLTGLAPILKDVGPLIGEVGEVMGDVLTPAMKVVQIILTPLIEGLNFLKPILPALAIGIGVLTVAFNALNIVEAIHNAIEAVNPFVWIGLAIVALIGIVVLMVKHWNEVVATLKKVWDAIADAGGAVLDFLGITDKADAATRKHTKAVEENSEALKKTKATFEDITKAANDYTDAIKKNREESEKNAKEGQDNAIAALEDIDEKLKDASKRAPGETEASLKEVRSKWVEHGKLMVKQQEDEEAKHHAAAIEIGAASDPDEKKKKVKDTTAKDEYAEIKERLAQKYTALKEAADNEINSDTALHARQLALQKQYDEELLSETEAFNQKHAKKKKDIFGLERKIGADKHAILKDEQDHELKQLDENTAKMLGELELRGIAENLTQGQIAKESYSLKRQQLEERLALETKFGRDTESTQKAIADLDRARIIEEAKQAQTIKKELRASDDAQTLTDMRASLEKLKSLSGDHASEIAEQESAIAKEEEEERYKKELESRKDELANDVAGDELRLSLKKAHEAKETAIEQKGADDQRKIQQAKLAFMLGPLSQGANKALDLIDKQVEKSIGLDQKKKTAFGQMANDVVSGYVKMGISALQHASISEVADAASASWKFISAAASGVASAFATIPFPFDLIAAAGVVTGVVELATHAKSIKLAAGGILTQPTFARGFEAGEAGHEAVIPLGSGRAQDALGIKDLGTKIDKSNALMETQNAHLSAIRGEGQRRSPSSPSSLYDLKAGTNRAEVIVGRRIMR